MLAENQESSAKKLPVLIASIIPEGYVDVIRHILPGAIILMTFCFLTGIPIPAAIWKLTFWGFIVFLLLSYAAGWGVDCVMEWLTSGPSRKYAWRVLSRDKEVIAVIADVFCMTGDEVERRKDEIPGLVRLQVIQDDPRAAILVPKLVAEEFLFKNLALGILLMFLLFAFILHGKPQLYSSPEIIRNEPLFIGILFAGSEILAIIGAIRRTQRTAVRTLEWFRVAYRQRFAALKQKQGPGP